MSSLNDLYIVEIKDNYVRENFRKIKDFNSNIFKITNMKFFEITVKNNVTNQKFRHGLGFVPKDIIQTSAITRTSTGLATTPAVFTWNFSLFDKDYLDITTTSVPAGGTIKVRALIGNLDGEG